MQPGKMGMERRGKLQETGGGAMGAMKPVHGSSCMKQMIEREREALGAGAGELPSEFVPSS